MRLTPYKDLVLHLAKILQQNKYKTELKTTASTVILLALVNNKLLLPLIYSSKGYLSI
jgi:hypothetical protein